MFEAAIAMSRKWNATEAGEEIGKQIIEKMKNKPKFVLLFSTIHYEKWGGFQKFLDAVSTQLPKGTPIVGGTVAGFINNYGCYARGASALAVYSDEMDVAVGVGHNTRRNPVKAAQECISQIKQKLLKSTYKNGHLLIYYSSAVVPSYPFIGRTAVINSKVLSKLTKMFYDFSLKILQKGVDRMDEFLPIFVEQFPEFNILANGCTDDIKQQRNFVFFNKNFADTSLVAIAFKTPLESNVSSSSGFTPTNIEFNITKFDNDRRNIIKIDNEPARKVFLKKFGWPPEYLDNRVFNRIFWYPVLSRSEKKQVIQVFGLFVENDIIMPYRVEGDKLTVLSASGRSILEASATSIKNSMKKTPLTLHISECGLRAITLGSKLFEEQKIISNMLGEIPFLSIFVAGETIYNPRLGLEYGNDTFKTMTLLNPE